MIIQVPVLTCYFQFKNLFHFSYSQKYILFLLISECAFPPNLKGSGSVFSQTAGIWGGGAVVRPSANVVVLELLWILLKTSAALHDFVLACAPSSASSKAILPQTRAFGVTDINSRYVSLQSLDLFVRPRHVASLSLFFLAFKMINAQMKQSL